MKLDQVFFVLDLLKQMRQFKDIPEVTAEKYDFAIKKNIMALTSAFRSDSGAVKITSQIDDFIKSQDEILAKYKKPDTVRELTPEEELFTDEQLADKAKLDETEQGKKIEAELKKWLEDHQEYKDIQKRFSEYELKLNGSWHRLKPEWLSKTFDRKLSDYLIEEGIVDDENFETIKMESKTPVVDVEVETTSDNP